MSQKIEDILTVLGKMRQNAQSGRLAELSDARISACKDVAEDRGVTNETVRDACCRRLEPDIKGTSSFDLAVQSWLKTDSPFLRHTLEKHALDPLDFLNVAKFFS